MEIYADNAATTNVSPAVIRAINDAYQHYGNPSSLHGLGRVAKSLVDKSRSVIAKHINCQPHEIIFTSSATESNNIAIKGYAFANRHRGYHIITSCIEHPSVLNTMQYLEKSGFEVTYLGVNEFGEISLSELEKVIRTDTILTSIMFVNNEIGTVQPIEQIGRLLRKHNICFHTDAVQAMPFCRLDVNDLCIDMLSFSGHKIHAPKGIGALYVRNGLRVSQQVHGGRQEFGFRAGTENIPYIIGIGEAVRELGNTLRPSRVLVDTLKTRVLHEIPDSKFNGAPQCGSPCIASFSFKGIDGEALLLLLDAEGIYASTASACSSGNLEPSHVIKAIGVLDDYAYGTVRFSFGNESCFEEIDRIIWTLKDAVQALRGLNKKS